jgi:hypothetical protein
MQGGKIVTEYDFLFADKGLSSFYLNRTMKNPALSVQPVPAAFLFLFERTNILQESLNKPTL